MARHFNRRDPGLPPTVSSQPSPLPTPHSTTSFWHTAPSALLKGHRTTRELPQTADVVVIGSGITGTSAAHHLLSLSDEKIHVVMLEAREACWGATGRNGGHCQPLLFDHPEDPTIGRFELNNFNDLQSLITRRYIDCEFTAQPGVRAIYDQVDLDLVKRHLEILELDAPEQAEMMRLVTDHNDLKQLRVPTACGAVVTSRAARLWPYKLVARLLEDLLTSTDHSGTFNLQTLTPVNSISQVDAGLVAVNTERGTIHARKVILATNAYTSHLLHDFADLIVPYRGQMSALTAPPSLSRQYRLANSYGFESAGNDDYLIQRSTAGDEQLMFGGGKQCGPSVGITDDSVVDPNVAEYLRHRLFDVFCLPKKLEPGPNANLLPATHMWTGIMGASRDRHPWVGAVPHRSNVYMSAGYNGHGMPSAWLCAKALAVMVLDTLQGSKDDDALAKGGDSVGLPLSYRLTADRVDAARQQATVAMQQWSEGKRGWSAAQAAGVV